VQTRTLAGVEVSVPAVVIAAPASGSGKTTVATGLMGALRRAGRRVAPFKVGPDFIDPGYHALAALRPGRNLDPVLVGEQLIGPLYRHGSAGADIAVVEGVMGLFDGRISEVPKPIFISIPAFPSSISATISRVGTLVTSVVTCLAANQPHRVISLRGSGVESSPMLAWNT